MSATSVERFRAVVENEDASALRALLASDPDVRGAIDRPIFEPSAPAIVACRGDRAMVDVLLDFGADINARTQYWARTIGVLDDNSPDMRAYLIQRGAVPEIGEFADAIEAQDAARVRSLLASTPALRAHVDRPLLHFGTPAIIAAKNNREIVETLLEFGANINVRTAWEPGGFGILDETEPGQAAWLIAHGAIVDIHAAAGLGMIDRVSELLARDPSLVHARGGDGQLPLHFARTIAIQDLLLDRGAEIDARDIDHHATAAQYKVREPELCRHLIARGAQVDIFMATALADPALVERVLAADPNAITARIGRPGYAPVPPGHIYQWGLEGRSVLQVAAKHGGPEVYERLRRRSPVKEQFIAACQFADDAGARRILAEHPAIVSELPDADRGEIVEAAFSHNIPALRLMLDVGFDPNVRGSEGFTAVSHAAIRGDVEVVRIMIAHGADLEILNNYGGTALTTCQWGSRNWRDENGDYAATAEALLNAGARNLAPDSGSDAVRAVLKRYARASGGG